MILALLLLSLPFATSLCTPSPSTSTSWPFSAAPGSSYSCSSSNGGVNDLGGNAPTHCAADLSSVYMSVTAGSAECLQARAFDCKILMRNFTSLDYVASLESCGGTWTAPLWMTPDTWQWGAGSGEVDSLEACPRSGLFMNFAGGGSQLPVAGVTLDKVEGLHVTVRKDDEGIVTIATCRQEDELVDGQCGKPSYDGCDDCLSNGEFACWCNGEDNIYSSGGCTSGTDCLWTLVSDIWNGVDGDEGYMGCMVEVPELGLEAGKPNLASKCAVSVENIVVRGEGGGAIQWGEGSSEACSALTL